MGKQIGAVNIASVNIGEVNIGKITIGEIEIIGGGGGTPLLDAEIIAGEINTEAIGYFANIAGSLLPSAFVFNDTQYLVLQFFTVTANTVRLKTNLPQVATYLIEFNGVQQVFTTDGGGQSDVVNEFYYTSLIQNEGAPLNFKIISLNP